jgi:hypothetical protein
MKRFVLLFLLILGAARVLPHAACSGSPRGPGRVDAEAGASSGPGGAAPSASEAARGTEKAPRWFQDAQSLESIKGELEGLHAIKGGLAITRERADRDARRKFEQAVGDWLARDGVPREWTTPEALLRRLIRAKHVEPVLRDDMGPELDDYKVWYEAAYQGDFSPTLKAAILAAHDRDVVRGRLGLLAGLGVFLLACLAALAGYIRMDEATKGYYTHPLRLVAAAGVGAAGVMIYQLLS